MDLFGIDLALTADIGNEIFPVKGNTMVATVARINAGSQQSFLHMRKMLGWVKVFNPIVLNISGVACTVYKDPSDPDLDDKLTGITNGIARVTRRGFAFQAGITFYCTAMEGVMSIAFHRSYAGTRQASVALGRAACDSRNYGQFPGIAHQMAPLGGARYCEAVVTHELGHNLHERANEGFFWDTNECSWGNDDDQRAARAVSEYATKNKLEFVAEVFTGIMYGETYENSIMDSYREYLGPSSDDFP